jgi:hypothetical protein
MGGEGRYQNIGSGGEVVLGRYLGSPRRECRRDIDLRQRRNEVV